MVRRWCAVTLPRRVAEVIEFEGAVAPSHNLTHQQYIGILSELASLPYSRSVPVANKMDDVANQDLYDF